MCAIKRVIFVVYCLDDARLRGDVDVDVDSCNLEYIKLIVLRLTIQLELELKFEPPSYQNTSFVLTTARL